jgi:hypothetical protein
MPKQPQGHATPHARSQCQARRAAKYIHPALAHPDLPGGAARNRRLPLAHRVHEPAVRLPTRFGSVAATRARHMKRRGRRMDIGKDMPIL